MSSPGEPRSESDRTIALRGELAALGIVADVSADGALAIIDTSPHDARLDAERRRAIVAAARGCGFTNVALELRAPDAIGSGAHVRRDQSER